MLKAQNTIVRIRSIAPKVVNGLPPVDLGFSKTVPKTSTPRIIYSGTSEITVISRIYKLSPSVVRKAAFGL
jgi:hypothetical protein